MLSISGFLRCMFSVTGIILVWSGTWVLYEDFVFVEWVGLWSNFAKILIGFIMMVGTKTFLFHASMKVDVRLTIPEKESVVFRIWHFIRYLVGLFGVILVWSAVYNIMDMGTLDVHSDVEYIVYSVYIIVGLTIRVLTDTICCSIIEPDRPIIYYSSLPRREKLWITLRAVVGIFGSVVAWVGLDHVLVGYDYVENQELLPKLSYIVIGIFLMTVTFTLPDNAEIYDYDWTKIRRHGVLAQHEHIPLVRTIDRYEMLAPLVQHSDYKIPRNWWFRTLQSVTNPFLLSINRMMGQVGYLMLWCGVESTLYFFAPVTVGEEISYVLIGLLIMWFCRSLPPGVSVLGEKSIFVACLPEAYAPDCMCDYRY